MKGCTQSFQRTLVFTRLTATIITTILLGYHASEAKLLAATATPNSVTLTWTAPGDDGTTGAAAQYDVRYSTSTITEANWNAASQASGEPTPQVAGSSESFTVDGLNPSTTYYFAIKAADEATNWSAISNVISRATEQETTAPAAVANLAGNTVTSSSVTLTWTAPGDDGNTGTASQYDIRYSTSAITEVNFNAAAQATGEPTPSVAGSAENFMVTGLDPSTTYYFALKTSDDVPNWSAISNVPSAATGSESTAPANVTNLAAVSPTEHTITLTWTAPGDDGTSGTASQYDIRYSTSNITAANFNSATQIAGVPAPKTATSPETLLVSGLNGSQTYYFALKTADEVPNWSGLSNVANRATTADVTPPAAIDDLQASTGTQSGQINLGWTAPGDDGSAGTAGLYQIRYSLNPITNGNFLSASLFGAPPIPQPAGTFQAATLSGLTPGQIYFVAIKTMDDRGNMSALSNVDSAQAYINISTDIEDEENGLPTSYELGQNYPNPFNPSTNISFTLPRASEVALEIYNIRGELVQTIFHGDLPAGEHQFEWSGNVNGGSLAATGVYLYRIQAGSFSDSKKMVLLK